MRPERWQRVKELFRLALEREGSQRETFLDEVGADDPAMRGEIESLIQAHEQAGDFIQAPALERAGRLWEDHRTESVLGRRIGPYQVLREIGQGGMGAVYLAERVDGQFRKQVAIKLVKRGMDTDAMLRRFRNEQQILAHLDHPNIAKLLDGGTTEDGLSYFIMDYVDGLPIDVYCDRHKLTIDERLKLFCTMCSAVQYAHEHQVVHRDLKPSNLLVTAEGVPKLLDFGIAKLLSPELSYQMMGVTTTALRPMTPKYASPEQVRGWAITPSSDIYSLGVLLYELLTGHYPYRLHSPTPQEIGRVICEEEPEKPSTVVSRSQERPSPKGTMPIKLTPESVSETREGQPEKLRRRLKGELDNIVLMALRKEPKRRYASVEQFSEDIRRHLEGLPVMARKDTLWYRSAKFIKRNKSAVLAALLAVALLALVTVGLYLFPWRDKAIDSIAVLPLANASADPDAEYLSDGITENLINSLSQLPKLRVVPRSLVFRYKGREVEPQRIGRDLGVRTVLTGRVFQRGDTLNIQTELIDVRNVSQLWGEQYKRKLSDILSVQEEISRDISERLRLRLTGEEKRRLTKRYTENIEAYQLYLRGRYYWNKRVEEGFKKGIDYFQQAIEKDPNYALAYAGLADCYTLLALYHVLAPKDSFPRAKAAVMKALGIDDTLAEAHTSLAFVMINYDWDFLGAEREFKRAIELNPNYATAHHWYSFYLMTMGRQDEAITEVKRAQELDPLSLGINATMGWIFYYARQYDQAIEQYRKTLEIDPNFFLAHTRLGLAYEQKGMYEEAIAEFQKAMDLSGGRLVGLSTLGYAYAVLGKRGEAREVLGKLKELSKQHYVLPFAIALIHIGLGEKDQAFEWLQRAYEERSDALVSLKVDPRLDGLRSDPRFRDLVRRVGLPM